MCNLFSLFTRSEEQFAFQIHDGGREAYGFKGGAGDCVVRSIAIASKLPYLQVYEELRNANAR